ncbi:sugar ABC transporter ATP-binding protein [Kitasatospora sp. NPDC048722]|uniref:sugar ABC transporter ATP-binding protein n=1 Tax=Kitasatospora sp. NPDC048722 TaxID=3155639 RepID=UPI003403AEAE
MTGVGVPAAARPAAVLRAVRKSYGPVTVLDIPELDLMRGQITCVVGENGAGKSTLMGVLSGTVSPSAGEVLIADRPLHPGRPDHAKALGVSLVAQEFPLVGRLSVAENLLLGRRTRARQGAGMLHRALFDRAGTRREARELLAEVGVEGVDVDRPVERLPVPLRQMIEIAKAWGNRPLVLILDEPTSSLGPVEAGKVLALARRHAAQGGAVLFIGHRLDEVRDIADRVLVLRGGSLVADLRPDEATEARMIREMVGGELAHTAARPVPAPARTVLTARGLTADGLGPVDLDLRAGEIVGVAGLMGSGRSRLLHTLMGAQPRTGGEVELSGRRFRPRHPADAVAAGVGLVPEDRKEQSLLLSHPVRWNATLATLRRDSWHGVLTPGGDRARSQRIVDGLGVRLHSQEQPIGDLSGGNQQKVVFGRWLHAAPDVLLLDEPTRGVDVGAKAEIYRLVDRAAADGLAVLAASSELEELLWICHRILVMAHGRIVADLPREQFGKERIMTAATSRPQSSASTEEHA